VSAVAVERPGPGEEVNLGPPTAPRQAASAIVLREGGDGLEVLLVERNPESRFMGGAWVFPGGSVQADDEGPPGTALRELEEEAGLRLADVDELVPFSRWITPAQVKTRFDTWFYVTAAPPDAEAAPDGEETVDARWIRPADALEAFARGEMTLVFPTIKHLEQLAELRSPEHAFETARATAVEPVEPRVVLRDGRPRVVLPGEAGYDD
jgi:8-oxo-dGTP pyrophosphatase MutT (NUDIX family)